MSYAPVVAKSPRDGALVGPAVCAGAEEYGDGGPRQAASRRIGANGHMDFVEPGRRSGFYYPCFICNGGKLGGWLCTCLQWPASSTAFLLIALCQECAPCWHPVCGEACCMTTSQMPWIHALHVISNTLQRTWGGFLFGFGWLVQVQPGILFACQLLSTPPKFLFDEEEDKPYLLTFREYTAKKMRGAPPFSGRYRAVDGGGNRSPYTFLGQGGRGYAMNEPFTVLRVQPDPEQVARDLQFRTSFYGSPFGHNAISAWFAHVAIHDFFRSAIGADSKHTGGVDKPWVNLHSGYLDLQVLYGFNPEVAAAVRTFNGGKLHRIAEDRFDRAKIPESRAIVELMRREHNHVCDVLLERDPSTFGTDEALYQQARLIMGGVFINIILRQYGDQMFGENPPEGQVFADVRQRNFGSVPEWFAAKQTVGNQPSYNFNLIYRWHTAIPEGWDARHPHKAETDDDLRAIFSGALREPAGGFGPNNMPSQLWTPHVNVPAATIRQGRLLGAPRLNDFRRRFMTPYRSIEDMCGDPAVAEKVRRWYPTIEDVELSVGCQVERACKGGWALGHTVSMAILADAFSTIRQDRFYTDGFTPEAYTPWGFEHAKTTILADLLNRHLGMGLPREVQLARLPSWEGPTPWREVGGCGTRSGHRFTARGAPEVP